MLIAVLDKELVGICFEDGSLSEHYFKALEFPLIKLSFKDKGSFAILHGK